MIRNALYSLLGLLAMACSLTAPRDVGNGNKINLHADISPLKSRNPQGGITIQLPEATSSLDTYRIAVTLADGREDYVAGARWNDFLTATVQSALREGFTQSHAFRSVNDDTESASTRLQLASEITQFHIVYAENTVAPTVRLAMRFTLKPSTSSTPLRQFTVEKTAVANANSMAAIRTAFNQAFTDLTQDVLKQAVQIAR